MVANTVDLTADDESEGDVLDRVPTNPAASNANTVAIERGYCSRCYVELIESAVLVNDDGNGVQHAAATTRLSSPHPATSSAYCALVKCACCLRSFAENDVEALSYLQRTRGARFQRCRSCETANCFDLFEELLAVNCAQDVLDRLQAAGMDIVNECDGGSCDYNGDQVQQRTQWVKAVRATSCVFRDAFEIEYRRAWLQHETPTDDLLYTPQLGDDVVFFPEAYNKFMVECSAAWALTCRPNYWTDPHRVLIDRSFAIKCRVVDVRYVFPDVDVYDKYRVVMVEITLAVLAVPKNDTPSRKRKRQQADEPAHMFDLVEPMFEQFVAVDSTMTMLRRETLPSRRYHLKAVCHPKHIEDYLVLDTNYEIGVCSRWNIGDRVETTMIHLDNDCEPMTTERFIGTIVDTDPVPVVYFGEDTDVMTPLLGFSVNWDGQEEAEASGTWEGLQDVSPWDLHFVDEQRQHLQMWQKECCSATHRRNARRISEDGRQQLLSAIDRLMAQRSFQYFVRLSADNEDDETPSPVSLPH